MSFFLWNESWIYQKAVGYPHDIYATIAQWVYLVMADHYHSSLPLHLGKTVNNFFFPDSQNSVFGATKADQQGGNYQISIS